MKTSYLFPHVCKRVGWVLLAPLSLLWVWTLAMHFKLPALTVSVLSLLPHSLLNRSFRLWEITTESVTDELVAILSVVALALVAFSKEKHEDEYIAKIRLESLMWATYISYAILIFCILFFYGFTFLYALIFNMFIILLVFIIRFNVALYRARRQRSEATLNV
ncbi:MAG: hypothetical protein LBS63_03715 [Prevotellaceae bacterium]|jgi:L-asparagine transporter-like permease|nr:hypothetical protein [Prevotellaceae bacterium]